MALSDTLAALEQFVEVVKFLPGTVYLGIDPGGSGALGFLHGDEALAVPIPTVKVGVTRTRAVKDPVEGGPRTVKKRGEITEFDLGAIVEVFEVLIPLRGSLAVALEAGQIQIRGKGSNNAQTAFRIGIGFGMWPLFLTSCRIPVEIVQPGVWKKAMGLAGKDKNAARLLAARLWPKVDLHRVGDHNRAEALLLAEHLRRLRTGAKPGRRGRS